MLTTTRSDSSFLADKCAQNWAQIMVRASRLAPTNIDGLLEGANGLASDKKGKAMFDEDSFTPFPDHDAAPSRRPAIGVLLDDREVAIAPRDIHLLATRYAALAIEKECDVVILSYRDNAGFERFGFRVERISGETDAAREACLAQLRRFWGFEIMI